MLTQKMHTNTHGSFLGKQSNTGKRNKSLSKPTSSRNPREAVTTPPRLTVPQDGSPTVPNGQCSHGGNRYSPWSLRGVRVFPEFTSNTSFCEQGTPKQSAWAPIHWHFRNKTFSLFLPKWEQYPNLGEVCRQVTYFECLQFQLNC